jgi:hypothetical protein
MSELGLLTALKNEWIYQDILYLLLQKTIGMYVYSLFGYFRFSVGPIPH